MIYISAADLCLQPIFNVREMLVKKVKKKIKNIVILLTMIFYCDKIIYNWGRRFFERYKRIKNL